MRAAEQALEHLELALKLSGPSISAELKDQIMPDVRKLKSRFVSIFSQKIKEFAFYRFLRRLRRRIQARRQQASDYEKCHLR